MKEPYSHLNIRDLLPHRDPFLFVDRITSLEPGREVRGLFRVRSDHPYVNSADKVSVFPPVLVVEALAQVAAICIGSGQPEPSTGARPMGYLARIDQCTFEQPVHADEELLLAAGLVARYGPLSKFNASAQVGDKTVARAALTLYLGS